MEEFKEEDSDPCSGILGACLCELGFTCVCCDNWYSSKGCPQGEEIKCYCYYCMRGISYQPHTFVQVERFAIIASRCIVCPNRSITEEQRNMLKMLRKCQGNDNLCPHAAVIHSIYCECCANKVQPNKIKYLYNILSIRPQFQLHRNEQYKIFAEELTKNILKNLVSGEDKNLPSDIINLIIGYTESKQTFEKTWLRE
jgi:hypothetical protein